MTRAMREERERHFGTEGAPATAKARCHQTDIYEINGKEWGKGI